MSPGLTKFARVIVYLTGCVAVIVCAFLLPELVREETAADPDSSRMAYPFLIGAYILTAPFFAALHQVLALLKQIEKGEAFSVGSVRALKNIKICAVVFGAMVLAATIAGLAWVRNIDPTEDVTGIVALCAMCLFAVSVIAVFAAVLQRLVLSARDIKIENDSIV